MCKSNKSIVPILLIIPALLAGCSLRPHKMGADSIHEIVTNLQK